MAENAELAAGLKKAKTTEMFFAFVASGAADGELLVNKKKVPVKDVNEAKKTTGGKKVFRGRMLWENGTMVFELAKEPPSQLAKTLKKVIKEAAGLTMPVETRVNEELEPDEEEGETTDGEQEPGTPPSSVAPPAAPPPPPPVPDGKPSDAAARFTNALKALAPVLEKATAANSAAATQARAQIAEGNKAFVTKKYDDANAALDRAETLIKQALSSVGAKPEGTPTTDGAARVAARLKALEPVLQKIDGLKSQEAKDVKQAVKEANAFVAKKQFDSANETLDLAESMLKGLLAGLGKPSGTAPDGKLSVVKLGKARIEWGTLRTKAVSDIANLKKALEAEFADDKEQASQLSTALKTLDGTIAQFNEALEDQLDAVLNAKDDTQRKPLADTAKATMARFTQFIDSDAIVAELDGNEIMPDMQVAGPIRAKLKEIAAALG